MLRDKGSVSALIGLNLPLNDSLAKTLAILAYWNHLSPTFAYLFILIYIYISDKQGVGDIHTHVLPYSHYDILNSCGPNQSVCCAFDFKRITHYQCYDTQTEAITKKNVKKKFKFLWFTYPIIGILFSTFKIFKYIKN